MSEQVRGFKTAGEEAHQQEGQGEDASQATLRRQPHLEIYEKHVLLADKNNAIERVWAEGKQSKQAQARYQRIIQALEGGFLDRKIEEAKSPQTLPLFASRLLMPHKEALDEVVGSVTAQSGRALVDILVLQLTVKAICPEQDVRLHKGSSNLGAFSWEEGISMRRLDDSYIVPTLRRHELLRMNQYGAFMTRTFAENYPYTLFYKAEIAGAKRRGKQRWLLLIDELEAGKVDAEAALLYVLQLLWKASEAFANLINTVLERLNVWIAPYAGHSISEVAALLRRHIEQSEARARLLEVALHALLQALEELQVDLGGMLKPLMPMRTANLKHGNIGDVEVLAGDLVVEAWDAKYDQPYLSDALDELLEKIRGREVSELRFGYVVFPTKKAYPEVDRKIDEIAEQYRVPVRVLTFDEWVREQSLRGQATGHSETELAQAWLRAYTESLALRRRDKAPIDEPTFEWVTSLLQMLDS